MNREDVKKRISKLRDLINHHRYLYHVLDKEEISEQALDSLKKELFDLENQFPEFVTKDSPTQRIGGKPLDKFQKVKHKFRMTSFNDAFSEKDMREWMERNKKLLDKKEIDKLDFFCEPKLDGLAIELVYRGGILETGATRGDGTIGEDVTQNIKTIEAIPLNISNKEDVIVRGEAVITKKEFERINKQREKQGDSLYANPRNLAAGSIRQLDSQITASRKLDADIYSLVTDLGQKTHEEEHEILAKLGFKTNNKHSRYCKSLEDIFQYHQWLEKLREKLPYEIDGSVVTINNNAIFQKLGIVGKAPRGAIAFKFAFKQATTIVEDVEFQTGRTGVITPVAILKPVDIEGVTITRATLHNEKEIERLGLKIGDTVIVGRAGDVIPDIIKVLGDLRAGKEKKIVMPKECPSCGTRLVRKTGDIVWYCPNPKCYNRKLRNFSHFVSKPALNITGLGPRIVKQLIDRKLVADVADLFYLEKGDLMNLEGFKERASKNLIESIKNRRETTLARFIFALGIDNVGQETAHLLANRFGSLKSIRKAKREEFDAIKDVGEVVSLSIYEWFNDDKNSELIDKILKTGLKIVNPVVQNKLRGKKFVVTGTLKSFSREEIKEMIRNNGGDVSESLSKSTDYLVVGENPGSKHDKAQKLGIKILKENDFKNLL